MGARFSYIFILNFFVYSFCFAQDEFKEWNDTITDTSETVLSDTAFSGLSQSAKIQNTASCVKECPQKRQNLLWLIGILIAAIISGVLIRYKKTARLRGFFLLGSIVFLGFYRGSCPCPVSGFQETFLFFLNGGDHYVRLLWFVGLIPVTYFFGKVWCGWICHLGALQELIFSSAGFTFFSSSKTQKTMRLIRIFVLVILLIQLLITKSILWNKIDPFKTAFNLFSSSILSWVLLAVLLISSLLIFRPFCKVLCPVGLVLGWISKIPGAFKVELGDTCVDCKNCSAVCKINAITYENKKAGIDNQECIACGQCLNACKHNAIEFH